MYDLAHDRAFAGARQVRSNEFNAPSVHPPLVTVDCSPSVWQVSSDVPLLHEPYTCKGGGQLKELLTWGGQPASGGNLSSVFVDQLGGVTDLTERRHTVRVK